MTKIYHAHLYGLREDKYQLLAENTVNSTDFEEVKPQSPFYLLIPQDRDLFAEYEQYFKITEAMPVNSVGIVTARDKLTIQDSPEAVWNFYIGGYQVCHKWLKDRKKRTLSDEDIQHYQKNPMKLAKIRQQGYKALTDALGVAGTLRFLQQLDVGYGDYTSLHDLKSGHCLQRNWYGHGQPQTLLHR